MKCPYCSSTDLNVVDTRKFDTVVLRVRVCKTCHQSFQTEETIQLTTPVKIIINNTKNPA